MQRSVVAALAAGFLAQTFGLVPQAARSPVGLTAEQARILAHMSLVDVDDGFGNPLPTIRIEGVNVQIVNGKGKTYLVNGLGNLIVGYHDAIAPSNRTGSHNVIIGSDNDYSSYSGLCSGGGNELLAPAATALSSSANMVAGGYSVVLGGFDNHVEGFANVAISGEWNSFAPDANQNVIIGGASSSILGWSQSNVIVGGYGHSFEESDNGVIAGGGYTQATGAYFCSAIGGFYGEMFGVEGSTLVGGYHNRLTAIGNPFNATVVGGQDNVISDQEHATVVGGQGNAASGTWSTVTGGLNRTATGEHDWVAGSLLEDD